MLNLVDQLPVTAAERTPDAPALAFKDGALTYAELATQTEQVASGLRRLGLAPSERVAVYLDKRFETVIGLFGAVAAGGVFVPVNPLLKPEQVAHILRDCNVRILITSSARHKTLRQVLTDCPDLRAVVLTNGDADTGGDYGHDVVSWSEVMTGRTGQSGHRRIDTDMAAILYTSGSTGRPKGVVLSHRNLVAGAESVARYLENRPDDRILSVLPLSFDYGLSQLTTAFNVGACAVLLNYLLPRDVVRAVDRQRITGLAAVPPLWVQLAGLDWPRGVDQHLRYMTSSGGRMPKATIDALAHKLPRSHFFVMYGLTEAFRSTYLPPEELPRRPDSMGKAIPNAEILVVHEDGTPCAPGEPGELIHRGSLVSLGYWNDPDKTAERFRPAPGQPGGLPLPEMAVWSGDTVKMDEDGYLYFVGRRDEMIKTSGYRVSPTEVEEVVYDTGLVTEAAAIGAPHPVLGEGIVLAVWHNESIDEEALIGACRERLPAFMVPGAVRCHDGPLPRNPNGKIDRKSLATHYRDLFQESDT